ncbi:location of vulva defective 1-like [Hyperolius riggenbachi]|uniref:location of vulva defective 1-like n=1 Tax=Hyperolius riggenbachi TaxID=752182 RepID=UPI0035A306B5
MAFIGILCVLSALTATGYSISCHLCVSADSSSCPAVSVLCPTNHVCGLKYTNMTINGHSTVLYSRHCSPPELCNITGSMTIPSGTVQTSTSCCNSDNCTPSIPTLSSNTNDTNDVTCRSCLTVNSDWCYTSDTITCTGSETTCLLQTTKITGSSQQVLMAMRGCATKNICSFGSQSFNSSDFTTSYNYFCTNGSIRIHTAITAPALLLLLLLKYVL